LLKQRTSEPANKETMPDIKVSIALATFNGAEYVVEQLDSFAVQTRVPDEIVVVDDASSDETPDLVERWASGSGLQVRLERNPTRLGHAPNFSRALSLVSGDVVFPSDQDDRWDSSKIERMLHVLGQQPETDVLICDARLADAELEPAGRTKLEKIRRAGMPEEAFFMGCCMAIRGEFLERVLPIPRGYPEHDLWIASIARALGRLAVLEEALQDYRLHDHNQSRHPANLLQRLGRVRYLKQRVRQSVTASLQASLKQRAANAQRLLDWAYAAQHRTASARERAALDRYIDELNHQIDSIDMRRELLDKRRRNRIGAILRLSKRNGYRHFSGWKSAIRDLVRR